MHIVLDDFVSPLSICCCGYYSLIGYSVMNMIELSCAPAHVHAHVDERIVGGHIMITLVNRSAWNCVC